MNGIICGCVAAAPKSGCTNPCRYWISSLCPRATLLALITLWGLLAWASTSAEQITFYHNDALGSPVAATDSTGTLLWRETYQPFGTRIRKEPSDNEIWYTGKSQNEATGLVKMGARRYSPEIGRFISPDPVDGIEQSPEHLFDRYAYANNNPYKYVDPDGRFAITAAVVFGTWLLTDVVLPSFQDVPFDSGQVQSAGFPLDIGALRAARGLSRVAANGLEMASTKRAVSKVDYITKPGSKLPNIRTDVPMSEFEKNLLDNGFTKSTSKAGNVNIFTKGDKKYTTRGFSKSTGGPTAEVFKNNRPTSKIRLGKE